MRNYLAEMAEALPEAVKNVHLSITLEGWPAAATFAVVCFSWVLVTLCGPDSQSEDPEGVSI